LHRCVHLLGSEALPLALLGKLHIGERRREILERQSVEPLDILGRGFAGELSGRQSRAGLTRRIGRRRYRHWYNGGRRRDDRRRPETRAKAPVLEITHLFATDRPQALVEDERLARTQRLDLLGQEQGATLLA